MNLQDEKNLIKRAYYDKDADAFGVLYDHYYDQIFAYILKRVGHYQTAQDLTSDVFFKSLNKLWQFQWRSLPFSSWLYTIANNTLIDHYRKNSKNHTSELNEELNISAEHNAESEIIEAQDELQRQADYVRLRKAIEKLDYKYQEVITLKYFEHKKIEEISSILGKKEGTVKSLLSRGVDRLEKIY